MIRALITGTVYGEPQARTSQAGKKYATAKVKADSGKGDGGVVWCSIVAFGEQADRLLRLANGAALSIAGKAEITGWLDKQGEPKGGLSIVVDELATLKGKPRPPQGERDTRPYPPAQRSKPAPAHGPAPRPDFNDELPEFM